MEHLTGFNYTHQAQLGHLCSMAHVSWEAQCSTQDAHNNESDKLVNKISPAHG